VEKGKTELVKSAVLGLPGLYSYHTYPSSRSYLGAPWTIGRLLTLEFNPANMLGDLTTELLDFHSTLVSFNHMFIVMFMEHHWRSQVLAKVGHGPPCFVSIFHYLLLAFTAML
jgi:hypothetical protein